MKILMIVVATMLCQCFNQLQPRDIDISIGRAQPEEEVELQAVVRYSRLNFQRALTVSVEGNIGSGKSTFLNFCNERPDITVYPEPIEKWRNVKGENLLAKFYLEPTKWAVPFQLFVGMTMADIYRRDTLRSIKMVERSLLSSRHVFLENMKRTGIIENAMGHVLDAWYDQTLTDRLVKPHAIVYIRTSPDVAYARLQSRARAEETTVGWEYLQQLHNLHESWIATVQVSNMLEEDFDLPVLVLNGDLPLDQMYDQYEECLQSLQLLTMSSRMPV